MKKILFVHGSALNKAGTENFMMNVIKNIDADFKIDLLVFSKNRSALDEDFLKLGAKIYYLSPRSFFKVLKAIKKAHYDLVHAHMNALNGIVLLIFKIMGIKVLISHSHGSKNFVDNRFLDHLENIIKRAIPYLSDHLLSCSKEAGDFLYGHHPYKIINNGIDLTRYRFNKTKRAIKREELKLKDEIALGAIGRLNFQKNPLFLLEVLNLLKKEGLKAKLFFIGEGELQEALMNKMKELKLEGETVFLGSRDDVGDILSALDFVLMPSLFEGLPYALVEAQASGAYCLASANVDRRTKMIDHFSFLKIDDPQVWAKTIKDHVDYKRQDETKALKEKGYDVKDNIKALGAYYRSLLK